MANSLTGDFDVVVEVGVPTINRLLAAHHQAERYPHSFAGRIVDAPPKKPVSIQHVVRTTEEPRLMMTNYNPVDCRPQNTMHYSGGVAAASGNIGLQSGLLTSQFGSSFQEPLRTYGAIPLLNDYTNIQGYAEAQMSPPSITLSSNPEPRVNLYYQIMARFNPDTGSPALPEFLQGELEVSVNVEQIAWQSGNALEVDFAGNDTNVKFNATWSDPPLTKQQGALLDQLLRNLLRTRFNPVNVMLPKGISLIKSKLMPDVNRPAVALLLNLRPNAPQNSNPASVTQILLAGNESFAVAAGRDYLIPTILDAIVKAAENVGRRDFSLTLNLGILGNPKYQLHLDFAVDLQPGQIGLTINVDAKTPSWLPNVNFTVRQAITLRLIGEAVVAEAVGDPSIAINTGGLVGLILSLFNGYFVNQFRPIRDQLLQQAQPIIQGLLIGGVGLPGFLKSLSIAAQLTYDSIEIQHAGIILRGRCIFPAWKPVKLESTGSNVVAADGSLQFELNGLNSWVPGGTAEQFTWMIATNLQPLVVVEQHRFITRIPLNMNQGPIQWCLSVRGSRITPNGQPAQEQVRANVPNCKITSAGTGSIIGRVPLNDRLAVTLPGGIHGPAGSAASSSVADVDLWRAGLGMVSEGLNTIVHFASSDSHRDVGFIVEALDDRDSAESVAAVVVVIQADQMPEIEPMTLGSNCVLYLTTDPEGSWREFFGVRNITATYLLNDEGRTVWHHDGPLVPEELTPAFHEHLAQGGRLSLRQLRVAVQRCAPAPDFLFEYSPGHWTTLEHLRGNRVLIIFWISWSAPSLAELRHLQRSYAESDNPILLAVNDGEPRGRACDVFETNGFTFRSITDSERQISRLYGITCWPTTISIDEKGLIEGVHFGMTPESAHND